MTLTRKYDSITSDRTRHSARLINGSLHYWEVSYLPGRRMDYYDADVAMTIADLVGRERSHEELRTWVRREIWADSLGLSAVDVIEHLQCSPSWAPGEKGFYEHDLDHFPQPRRKGRKAAAERDERDEREAGA